MALGFEHLADDLFGFAQGAGIGRVPFGQPVCHLRWRSVVWGNEGGVAHPSCTGTLSLRGGQTAWLGAQRPDKGQFSCSIKPASLRMLIWAEKFWLW